MLNQKADVMELRIKGNWNQFKGELKERYGELTDDELKMAEGKADELIGILQEKTGKTKEQIEEELQELESKHL